MIRKLLMVAAATAMPLGAIAVGVGGGVASAKAPTPLTPITCTASGTVTFAAPGISHLGSVSQSKTSAVTTTATTFSACTGGVPINPTSGSSPANVITSKNTKCPKNPPYSPPTCIKPAYLYGTASSFAQTGPAALQKALKKLNITLGSLSFKGKTTGAAAINPGGVCGPDTGFALTGTLKSTPKSTLSGFTLNACLGADTGTSLASGGTNFYTDIVSALGGGADVISGASIDGASSLNIH